MRQTLCDKCKEPISGMFEAELCRIVSPKFSADLCKPCFKQFTALFKQWLPEPPVGVPYQDMPPDVPPDPTMYTNYKDLKPRNRGWWKKFKGG